MITKITMNGVASYKSPTTLETDKKVNLLYGLNGTGKSTISNYLSNLQDPQFSQCRIDGFDSSHQLLVYNEKFVNDNFYSSDEQKGIFTLSKKNADTEKKIIELRSSRKDCEAKITDVRKKAETVFSEIQKLDEAARDAIWEIKTKYTGGDRVFEYCLDKLKRKENLFSYLTDTKMPESEPLFSIEDLRKEIEVISGESSSVLEKIEFLDIQDQNICGNNLWTKVIVGNANSTLSDVIQKLNNSDWVKSGISYIDLNSPINQECPFCQELTITPQFIIKLKTLFDKSYDDDTSSINRLFNSYTEIIRSADYIERLQENPINSEKLKSLKQEHLTLLRLHEDNIRLITTKITSPSEIVNIKSTELVVQRINGLITSMNADIEVYNKKIEHKDKTLLEIKTKFWELNRWKYNKTLLMYQDAISNKRKNQELLKKEELECAKLQDTIDNELREEFKKTVNIDESVERIKSGLLDLGIEGFTIEKYENNTYRIVRPGEKKRTFVSLSEGEKTIISFLYFLEYCRGTVDMENVAQRKVVVIDDPVSSLSHIYVFNVSQLIKSHFTSPDSLVEQVFVFTHSLYFFYDLTFTKKENRDIYQMLFRVSKNSNGSSITSMRYTEIQNDYQAYWQVVKDKDQAPALVANCMRNIIEYFFSFVEKRELSNVFQKPSLKEIKFQAFYSYVNRESHSLGQNIFDMKEFDYDIFKDAFKLVFVESGYENHYKRMIA